MAEYKNWSTERVEAEYRAALDEYERFVAEKRSRLLDLRRARDARLEAMDPQERDAWEREHATRDEKAAVKD